MARWVVVDCLFQFLTTACNLSSSVLTADGQTRALVGCAEKVSETFGQTGAVALA